MISPDLNLRDVPLAQVPRPGASVVKLPDGSGIAVVHAPSLAAVPLPDRRWMVEGWVPDRSVTLFGGDGGVGKSLVALQLMIAAATGTAWIGQATKRVKTFGFFCEDDHDELHIRTDAIARGTGFELADLDGVAWSARAGEENILYHCPSDWNRPPSPTPLWHRLREMVLDHGAQLVIIDTAADVFSGNENFRAQVRGFVGLLRKLAQEIDGAVVLTAHPSVAGMQNGSGLSGSTAWNNSVRSRLYLSRPGGEDAEDPDARILTRKKSNYGSIGETIKLRWQGGLLVPEPVEGWLDRRARDGDAERAFLAGVVAMAARGVHLSPNKSATYAPAVLSKSEVCPGFAGKDLERAMWRLIKEGKLRSEEHGPASKRRSRLVIATGGGNA